MANRTFGHYYLIMIAVSVLCGLALLGIGYVPTLRIAGGDGVTAMFVGVAVSVVATVLGSLPVAFALVGPPAKVPLAILGATCVRFLVVLMLVAPLAYFQVVQQVPFVLWVAISYLVLLLVDTLNAVFSLRSLRETTG